MIGINFNNFENHNNICLHCPPQISQFFSQRRVQDYKVSPIKASINAYLLYHATPSSLQKFSIPNIPSYCPVKLHSIFSSLISHQFFYSLTTNSLKSFTQEGLNYVFQSLLHNTIFCPNFLA